MTAVNHLRPPIAEGDDTLRLSNSEAKMWKRCRRRWMLAMYLKRGKRTPDFGRPSSLGTRVHNALEVLYDPEQQDVDVLGVVQAGVEKDLAEHPAYETDILKEGELAKIMIEGYLQWLEEEAADMDLELVSSEEGVVVQLIGEEDFARYSRYKKAVLLSKIDVRVRKRSDGSHWALDHKTVGDLKTHLPLLQINAQMLTEHLAEFLKLIEDTGDVEQAKQMTAEGVLYNMLRKVKRTASAKPPFYKRDEIRHNIHELRNHWTHVVAIAHEIAAAHDRLDGGESHHTVCPPNDDPTCSWQCPFFQLCPLLDDGSDWETALDDLYEVVDPLERYNRDEAKEA